MSKFKDICTSLETSKKLAEAELALWCVKEGYINPKEVKSGEIYQATCPNRYNPFMWVFMFVIAVLTVLVNFANEVLLGWIFTPARRRKDWNKFQVFFF